MPDCEKHSETSLVGKVLLYSYIKLVDFTMFTFYLSFFSQFWKIFRSREKCPILSHTSLSNIIPAYSTLIKTKRLYQWSNTCIACSMMEFIIFNAGKPHLHLKLHTNMTRMISQDERLVFCWHCDHLNTSCGQWKTCVNIGVYRTNTN